MWKLSLLLIFFSVFTARGKAASPDMTVGDFAIGLGGTIGSKIDEVFMDLAKKTSSKWELLSFNDDDGEPWMRSDWSRKEYCWGLKRSALEWYEKKYENADARFYYGTVVRYDYEGRVRMGGVGAIYDDGGKHLTKFMLGNLHFVDKQKRVSSVGGIRYRDRVIAPDRIMGVAFYEKPSLQPVVLDKHKVSYVLAGDGHTAIDVPAWDRWLFGEMLLAFSDGYYLVKLNGMTQWESSTPRAIDDTGNTYLAFVAENDLVYVR